MIQTYSHHYISIIDFSIIKTNSATSFHIVAKALLTIANVIVSLALSEKRPNSLFIAQFSLNYKMPG